MPIIRSKKPVTSKDLYEASVALNEKLERDARRRQAVENISVRDAIRESCAIYEASSKRASIQDRYAHFSEGVKSKMLNRAICDIATSAMAKINESFGKEFFTHNDSANLGAITSAFIHENGEASTLLYNMKKGNTTIFLSELSKIIKDTHRSILEGIDSMDPDSYSVSTSVMDNYDDKVKNTFGHDEFIDNIAERVAAAVKDFMTKNAEDKQKIIDAMTATKQKLDSMKDAPDGVKESYMNLGRRYITDVRERGSKNLFNEMVIAMSKSVVKSDNQAIKEAFINEAHLNMDKIVKSVATMYTFLETVNSMRLVKVDEAFINDILASIAE